MKMIDHPPQFKEGVRVLLLTQRKKDGETGGRTRQAVSYDASEFDGTVEKLLSESGDLSGYRLYGSVDARDTHNARRVFALRQIKADWGAAPDDFYRALNKQWLSCLGQNESRKTKYFLFDIDSSSLEEFGKCEQAVRAAHYTHWKKYADDGVSDSYSPIVHRYATKNGFHLITEPFNRAFLSKDYSDMVHSNAMMLWGYDGA